MKEISESNKFRRSWFVFFVSHLLMLLIAGWSIYDVHARMKEFSFNYDITRILFLIFLFTGLLVFTISLLPDRNYRGIFISLALCLLISFFGLLVLFALNSIFFLLWFILGLFGTGLHLLRYWRQYESKPAKNER